MNKLKEIAGNIARRILIDDIVNSVTDVVDKSLMDISTTIGSFVVRSVRGKLQRSITFTTGLLYSDMWMEEALYGILYKYNNLKNDPRLKLTNIRGSGGDGNGMYYQLEDGAHNLKYRDWDILLVIQSRLPQNITRSSLYVVEYTIICFDTDPKFVRSFEADMLRHRNAILKIRSDSTTINVYRDGHETDGYTYWEKSISIPKRKLGTIYLPEEQKKLIVNTVNEFFANKKYYNDHGISHNLKILLWGEPGPQPEGSLIPTPTGYRKIQDLEPGDEVFTYDGSVTNIEYRIDYDNLVLYELEFTNHRKIRVCQQHSLPVLKQGKIVDMGIETIFRNGWISDDKMTSTFPNDPLFHNYTEIPNVLGHIQYPTKELSFPLSLLAFILVHGEIKHVETWTFDDIVTIRNDNINLIYDRCPSILTMLNDIDLNGWCIDQVTDSNDIVYVIRMKDHIMNINDLPDGIFFDRDNRIFQIPPDYMYNSEEIRTSMMNAFISFYMNSGSRIKVENEIIRNQIVELINGLSYDAYIDKDYVCYSTETSRSSILKSIARIEDKVQAHCLHVTHPSHYYITTDFIMSCNSGKDSIAKMIASEWNRNIYYVTGGKGGKFIPNALTDYDSDIISPLYLISDIDKYPFIINEPDVDLDNGDIKGEKVDYKQVFGSMINALDGVLSGEDKIIIMTTNHRDKFSETFTRPGRIDLDLEISTVVPETFRKYVFDVYHKELPEDIQIKDKTTIAQMQFDAVFLKMEYGEFVKKYVI